MNLDGIGKLADLARGVVDRIWPNKTEQERAEMAQALAEINREFELAKAQIEVNKVEAGSLDKFVSRGRPACIWIGALSMAYAGLLDPFMRFVSRVVFGYQGEFPEIDSTVSVHVLFALLGVSGMRSFDKRKAK